MNEDISRNTYQGHKHAVLRLTNHDKDYRIVKENFRNEKGKGKCDALFLF